MTSPDPNASGDGQGQQSAPAAGEGGQTGDSAQGGATGTGSDSGSTSTTETVSKADFEALRARMQAADQRASKAEGDLKQLRDKDLPELDKAKRDLVELGANNEKLKDDNQKLRVENSFLTDNTFKWRNPASALKLLDRSKLTVDSDGNVLGMKDALAALAKSDAYLLEPEAGKDGEGQGQQGQQGPPGTAAGAGPNNATGAGKKALETRFSALRGRAR